MPLNHELSPILSRIPAWAGEENIQVERIAGLTNTNYRIEVNGERFVLRISRENTAHLIQYLPYFRLGVLTIL